MYSAGLRVSELVGTNDEDLDFAGGLIRIRGKGRRERLVLAEHAEGKPFDFGRFDLIEEDWPADELAAAQRLAETGEGFLPVSAATEPEVTSQTARTSPHGR